MTNFSEIPVQLSDEFPRSQDKRVRKNDRARLRLEKFGSSLKEL